MSKEVELTCMVCNGNFRGEEPKMCCSGRECGCMGLPIDPVVCSERCYYKLPMYWKKPSHELPKISDDIEVSYDGGKTWDDSVAWLERRICMMAGIAGGSGYFGPGWGTTGSNGCDTGLICDPPDYWRYKFSQPTADNK